VDVESTDIFFEIFAALGAGDGDDGVSLSEDPGEGELGGGAVFFFGDLFDAMHEVEILLEIFSLKTRSVAAVVVSGEIVEAAELAGEESAAERAVGDEADAEIAAGGEDFVLGIARPEGVFGLQRGDGMNLCGAAKSFGAGLGESDMTDLAFLDELRHGVDGFFDGRVGVDAVLVVEVDVIDAETAQAALAGFADIVGFAVDAAGPGIGGVANDAEFGGEDDFVALAHDGASDELFVSVRSVDVGGVEEGDAEIDGLVDGGDGFGVVASGVELRHAHAAESFGGNLESAAAKRAGLHDRTFLAE